MLDGIYLRFGLLLGLSALCGRCVACFRRRRGRPFLLRWPEPVEFARRHLWLREMGLIHCQLMVADLSKNRLHWLHGRELT